MPKSGCKYPKDVVQQKVAEVPFWGHSIPLPYGIMTPGQVMRNDLRQLELPDDLHGKRVLDVGTWDGFYAFEAENRGADVVAIDNLNRMLKPNEKPFAHFGSAGFETAKDILSSDVQYRSMDLYGVSPETVGKFDITLFLGVLYHLRHPILGLECLSSVTEECLVIETEWLRTPFFMRRPIIEHIEGATLNEDPTNHCRPSTGWLKAVLADLGFQRVEVMYKSPFYVGWAKMAIQRSLLVNGRIILKAFR